MANKLKSLSEDLLFELQDEEIVVQGEDMDDDFIDTESDIDDIENIDDETEENKSDSFVRMETTTKIRGVIRRVNYEVVFQDLADEINDEINGVTLTRTKARQLFHIFKNSMGF